MMLTAIETGLPWGELIALRPASLDVYTRRPHVRHVYIEVSQEQRVPSRPFDLCYFFWRLLPPCQSSCSPTTSG